MFAFQVRFSVDGLNPEPETGPRPGCSKGLQVHKRSFWLGCFRNGINLKLLADTCAHRQAVAAKQHVSLHLGVGIFRHSSLAKLPAFEPEQSVTSSVRDEKLQQALANSCSTIGKTTSQTLSSCVRLFIAPDAHQNDSPGHTRSSRTITGWSSRVSSSRLSRSERGRRRGWGPLGLVQDLACKGSAALGSLHCSCLDGCLPASRSFHS